MRIQAEGSKLNNKAQTTLGKIDVKLYIPNSPRIAPHQATTMHDDYYDDEEEKLQPLYIYNSTLRFVFCITILLRAIPVAYWSG